MGSPFWALSRRSFASCFCTFQIAGRRQRLSRLPNESPSEASFRVRTDHALSEDKIAVEAPFAGLDNAIAFLCQFIERKSLGRAHGQRPAMRGVDLTLHLDLHGENLVGFADD